MESSPPSPRDPRRSDDLLVIAVLLLAAAGLLIATLPGIDMGGDAAWKWAFVRSWGRGLPWVYDHHTARFAVNVPIYVSQRVLGTHVNAMYAAPVTFALLQVALVYECGRRLCSRGVGIAAVAALLAFEPWAMAAGRLLPGVFQTTYVVLALLCYAQFARSAQRRWLVLLGVSMLLAYEAMITSLYFVPGFVLAVWWQRKRVTDNIYWFFVLLAGIALETALYAWLSDFPRGQLQIAGRTHINVEPITFWGLFQRYAVLPRVWQLGLFLGTVLTATAPWLTRSRAVHGLCMVIGSVFIAMTFGIKQLDPLVPALNFRARYFDPLVPLLGIVAAASIRAGLRAYLERKGAPEHSRSERFTSRQVLLVACVATICEATVLIIIRGVTGPEQLAQNAQQEHALSDAYLTGTPIVGSNARDHDQIKTMTVIAFAFFSDEAFWAQPDPRKPRVNRIKVGRRSHRVMMRTAFDPKRMERDVAKKRCVVLAARISPEQGLDLKLGDTAGCAQN
jgi:hypothetical protein